jgi:acyl phosphate:glycerol-3-phosphate acyltransferase
MRAILLSAVVGYLLGSIPFGYLLVRLFRGQDVRTTGSGNIGATNVSRTSLALGSATLLLDALKGTAAVLVSGRLSVPEMMAWVDPNAPPYPEHAWTPFPSVVAIRATIAALFAVLGHIFPVWLKFRGGKGVATALGAFLTLAPSAMLASVAVFLVTVILCRYISVGSIVATAAFPVLVWVFYRDQFAFSAIVAICLSSCAIILRHRQNIGRLLSGTEPRIELRRK